FLQATAPLWVVLLSPWLLGEKVRGRDLIYMLALALGLACFFIGVDNASATAPHPLLGNILSVFCGLTWGLTVIGLRALARSDHGGQWAPASALWGNVLAVLVCLPMALPVSGVRAADVVIVLYLGIFQLGIAYVLLLRGIANVRA